MPQGPLLISLDEVGFLFISLDGVDWQVGPVGGRRSAQMVLSSGVVVTEVAVSCEDCFTQPGMEWCWTTESCMPVMDPHCTWDRAVCPAGSGNHTDLCQCSKCDDGRCNPGFLCNTRSGKCTIGGPQKTSASCWAACAQTEYLCNFNTWQCYVAPSSSATSNLKECSNNCQPRTFRCDSLTGSCIGDAAHGQTKDDCLASCLSPALPTPTPAVMYTCDSAMEQCLPSAVGTQTADDCLASCLPPALPTPTPTQVPSPAPLPTPTPPHLTAPVAAGSACGVLALSILLLLRRRRVSNAKQQQQHGAPLLGTGGTPFTHTGRGLRAFEQAELEKATGGFASHSKLAEGTFGVVFRSDTLVSGRSVAIKVLKPGAASKMQDCAEEWTGAGTFRKELEVLGNYQHHNIVELLGYCLGCNSNQHPLSGCLPFNQAAMTVLQQPCLVFEFMAGGSLGMRLRAARDDRSAAAPLSCAERFDIASDVARGLEYLHTADPPLIHQDVKSDNILLCYFQGCLVAKVADFGTARFAPALLERGMQGALETHHSTQNVVGTRPYMPSEYTHLGHVSEKTDAFAFGVVLCELLTGLPPANHDAGEMLATTMPRPLADAERLLPPMLDKRIGGNDNMWPPLRAITLGRVAARCIEPDVSSRCVVAAVRPELDALAGREGQIGGAVVPNPRLVSNERGVRLAHDTASVERPLVPGASGTTGAGLERVESDTLGYQARSEQPLTASSTEQTDGGRPVSSPRIVSNERGVRLAHDTASAERPLVPASSSQDYS